MNLRVLPPGLLAYIGDSIYEIQARTWLLGQGYRDLNKIHKKTVEFVNATAQARGLKFIEPELTEEEESIIRRGRNARTGSIPKNTDMIDYRLSTGLEALFGYLYLKENHERINQLWELLVEGLEDE